MSADGMEILTGEDNRALAAQSASQFAIAASEIDMQISTAKKYPRSTDNFQKRLRSQALLNQGTAAQCTYKKPRGGKVIEGPSVRFMEMVIANWGNCRAGVQVVGETATHVTAMGFFHDLETNVSVALPASRSIVDSKGKRFDADMIATTTQAAVSVAYRNVVQKGVPKALWNEIHEEAKRVALGDLTTLAQRRQNALDWFKNVGVTERQICETLGVVGIADITLDKLAILGGFKVAIEEDGTDPEEIFVAVNSRTQSAVQSGRGGKKAQNVTPPVDPNTNPGAAETAGKTQPAGADGQKAPSASSGNGMASGPQPSDDAGAAGNGASGQSSSAVAESTTRASSEAPSPPLPITDKETAAAYATWLKAKVNAAESVDQIDDLHADAMRSGQWRALQQHDAKAYAHVANVMADKGERLATDDGQRPPD